MTDSEDRDSDTMRTDEPLTTGGGSAGLLWGVGAVSRRTGIAAPTLRSWDRRYGLGPSVRTEGGHRRYAEVDVVRVEHARQLIDAGVPAYEAAAFVRDRGQADVAAYLEAAPSQVPVKQRRTLQRTVDAIVLACERLDGVGLSRAYAQTIGAHGTERAWTDVLAPALIEIGLRWEQGDIGVEAEHLASERLLSELRGVIRARRRRTREPAQVVLAGAEGDSHVLPLLALEAALADRRIPCLALGGLMPDEAVGKVASRVAARVVFVWASMPRSSGTESLGRHLPATELVVGGPGWPELPAARDRRVTVHRVHDLGDTVQMIADFVKAA